MNNIAKRIGKPIINEDLNTERNVLLQKYKFEPSFFGINEGYLVTDFDKNFTRLGGFDYGDDLDIRFGKIKFSQNGPRQLPTTDHSIYLREYKYNIE